jgi:hypothetical protein
MTTLPLAWCHPIRASAHPLILRKPEVRGRIPVGKTKFEEDIAPRLEKIQLGPRCVGFTESSVDRLIKELVTESATAPQFVPPPNKKRKVA